MQLDIKDFLADTGLDEALYPGKRVVQKLAQGGDYKSHCVVYDWRATNMLRLDIKAGMSGQDLPRKDLAKYPVSFQSPTFIEFDTSDRLQHAAHAADETDADAEEEGEGSASGSGGGGGKKFGNKKTANIFSAFSSVVEGKVPSMAEVKKMVVLGKDIAATAFESVLKIVAAQIKNLTVTPVNILAAAIKPTVATPGGRALGDLHQGLVERADIKYSPKDMFGIAPS